METEGTLRRWVPVWGAILAGWSSFALAQPSAPNPIEVLYDGQQFIIAAATARDPLTPRLPLPNQYSPFLFSTQRPTPDSEPGKQAPVQLARGIYIDPQLIQAHASVPPPAPKSTSTECDSGLRLPERTSYVVCFAADDFRLSDKDRAGIKEFARGAMSFVVSAYANGATPGHEDLVKKRLQEIMPTLTAADINSKDIGSTTQWSDSCQAGCDNFAKIAGLPAK